MKGLAIIVVAALAGCGEPSPLHCTDASTCGIGGICIADYCAVPDLDCPSGFRFHESAGHNAGRCADPNGSGESGSGNGSDAGSGGNEVSDSILTLKLDDVYQTVDVTHALDDIQPICAAAGGRDVMFDVNLTLPRFYIDTYGTNYDHALAIYSGTCASQTKALLSNGCVGTITSNVGCDARTKQWSHTALLPTGPYCVVVDQLAVTSGNPTLTLEIRGVGVGPSRLAPLGATLGDTCQASIYSPESSCAVPNGPDYAWFFMACTGDYEATMMPASWAGMLEAADTAGTLECSAGATGVLLDTGGRPTPFMIVGHDVPTCSSAPVTLRIQPF